MLRYEGGYPRPGGECKESFNEASADERASAKAFSTCPAERVKLRDQGGYFGRVEKCRDVANSRAARYLASCHSRVPLGWPRPSAALTARGPLFLDLQDLLYSGHRTAPMPKPHVRRELEHENVELRAALLEQWEEAHFDHCGRLPHAEGQHCMWPPPVVLGVTPNEAYEIQLRQGEECA